MLPTKAQILYLTELVQNRDWIEQLSIESDYLLNHTDKLTRELTDYVIYELLSCSVHRRNSEEVSQATHVHT